MQACPLSVKLFSCVVSGYHIPKFRFLPSGERALAGRHTVISRPWRMGTPGLGKNCLTKHPKIGYPSGYDG
jgi:hypothetical protein